VLSPPIYWLVQWLGGQGILSSLAEFPFRRFFSRTAQVTAIVLLVPLLLWLSIRSVKEFGLARNPHRLRDLTAGLLIPLVPVVLLGAGYLFFEVYAWKKELNFAPMLRIMLTAGFVAVVEEWLLNARNLLFHLRRRIHWRAGLGRGKGGLVFLSVYRYDRAVSHISTQDVDPRRWPKIQQSWL
jgi:hypothetical protein